MKQLDQHNAPQTETAPPAQTLHESSLRKNQEDPVLSVNNLTVSYGDKTGVNGVNLKTDVNSEGLKPGVNGVDLKTSATSTSLKAGINGVSLTVHRGEVVALVGKSGAGKTTVLKAIAGLLPASAQLLEGDISINGMPVQALNGTGRCGKELAAILQNPGTSLDPCMRVGAQIEEVIRVHDQAYARDAQARSIQVLESVGLADPTRVHRSYPHELSGGQQQRVALALALVLKPHIVIADEPTSALDTMTQRIVVDQLLKQQKAQGFGLLIVTHNIALAYQVADKVAVMREGRIIEQGDAKSVIENPQHAFTRDLIAHAPRSSAGALRELKQADQAATQRIKHDTPTISGSVATTTASLAPTEHPTPAPVNTQRALYEIADVTYTFPGETTPALTHVGLTIYEGERLALIGPSGAGKSVLSSLLVRRMAPSSGTVTYHGSGLTRQATPVSPQTETNFWREVQMVFQDPLRSLDREASVFEILAEPLINYEMVPLKGFAWKLIRSRWKTSRELHARIDTLLESVELASEYKEYQLKELSGGQQQRVALARALAINPRCLILDEAFSGFDTITQSKILTLLGDLQAQRRQQGNPLTLIIVDHDICRVSSFADRIILVEQGRAGEDTSASSAVEKLKQAAYALPETVHCTPRHHG